MTVRQYIWFFIMFMSFLSCGSYVLTRAFFTDSAISIKNSFTAAQYFNTNSEPTVQEGKVVINEVSPNGDGDDEWIELYNPSAVPVDITGWKIHDNGVNPEALVGTISIPARSFAVIVASGSGVVVPTGVLRIESESSTIGNGLTSSSEKIRLLNEENKLIDQLSFGNDTSIFALPPVTANVTIQRKNDGDDTDTSDDWELGVSTLGLPNN